MKRIVCLLLCALLSTGTHGQGAACVESGWFGESCRYKCRCSDPAACNSTTGQCGDLGLLCQPGWFGPSCQYASVVRGVEILNGTGSDLDVTDQNISTCAVASQLQITLDSVYSVVWIRILTTDVAAWRGAQVWVLDRSQSPTNSTNGTLLPCTGGNGSAVVVWPWPGGGGGAVDVHCREGLAGGAVTLSTSGLGTDGTSPRVCSVFVSGGRNLAIRQATQQIGTLDPFVSARSVDGNTNQTVTSPSCSRTSDNAFTLGCAMLAMTLDPWWTVTLAFEIKVSRIVVYARAGNEAMLAGLRLFTGVQQFVPLYQHPPNNSFPLVLTLRLPSPVRLDRVALQVSGTCRIVDFCELQLFGERLCPNRTYGLNCDKVCACRNVTEVCQPTTGGCVSGCPDGYTGIACDQKCNATRYGTDCSQTCSAGCMGGSCDHVNGTCPLGCSAGWFVSRKCERACGEGFWGTNCSGTCPSNCSGPCNSIGLCVNCRPGYTGIYCEKKCSLGLYGNDCKSLCSFNCDSLGCNHVTGACTCKTGYKPDLCLDSCDATTWGPNCTNKCSTRCKQQSCDAMTGNCSTGCSDGFLGSQCDQACGAKTFGENCTQSCSPKCQDLLCNNVDGRCTTCLPGFKGDLCDVPCPPGTWGSGCGNTCSAQCGGGDKTCSPEDGTCNQGCQNGYTGARCTQECPVGTFGANCTQTCSSNCRSAVTSPLCHHVTGNCLQGCQNGYVGASCLTQEPVKTGAIIGGVVPAVIVAGIIIFIIVFFVLRRRKKNPKYVEGDNQDEGNGNVRLSASPPYSSINQAYVRDKDDLDDDEASDLGISMATERGSAVREKTVYYNTCPEMSRTRVAVQDLPAYVKSWREDPALLVKQFENLPKGLINTTSVAQCSANKGKNRYRNICAYDHSRVKLNIIDGDPYSDYINANYISGFDGQPKYIACQGPNAVILNDFVRMLWEKRVTTVVMLTNTQEAGKHKCDQYWPDFGEKKFGSVTVTLLSVRQTADYVIRVLQLAKEGRKIQLTQHHFTSWPDKGVPFSPWPLVDFHLVVSSHLATQPPEIPVVVHCSAGIGRSGTFLALDSLLAECVSTLGLDFHSCVWKLRQARVNMVQTAEQYIFLHEAVLVALSVAGSLQKKDSLPAVIADLRAPNPEGHSKMADEFKRLGMCQVKDEEGEYETGRQDVNISKNRHHNILPRDSHRVVLTSSLPESNDYINAILLPGYRRPRQFVVTQMPLTSTVVDLWRLIGDFPVSTIVTFPSTHATVGDTPPQFLPEEGQTSQFGQYKVTGRSYTQHDGYSEGFLHVAKSKRLPVGRQGRELHALRCDKTSPDSNLMLAMAQAAVMGVPEGQLQESLILVVCRTGAEMSGVFVAVAHLLQRLAEAPASVPVVVGTLRTVRHQLVSTLEQYQMVYDAVRQYAINSGALSNLGHQQQQPRPATDDGSRDTPRGHAASKPGPPVSSKPKLGEPRPQSGSLGLGFGKGYHSSTDIPRQSVQEADTESKGGNAVVASANGTGQDEGGLGLASNRSAVPNGVKVGAEPSGKGLAYVSVNL